MCVVVFEQCGRQGETCPRHHVSMKFYWSRESLVTYTFSSSCAAFTFSHSGNPTYLPKQVDVLIISSIQILK